MPFHQLSPHTSCSGLNPAPAASGENRSDLFQHSELEDMHTERVVILVVASSSLIFIALVVERFNQHSALSVVWNLCPRSFFFFFSDPCILAFHQRDRSTGRSLLYPLLDNYEVRFSLTASIAGMEISKKLQPALSSPSTNSPMSLLLHSSSWLLLSNSELWCWHTKL